MKSVYKIGGMPVSTKAQFKLLVSYKEFFRIGDNTKQINLKKTDKLIHNTATFKNTLKELTC
jgi:hypothetical protein